MSAKELIYDIYDIIANRRNMTGQQMFNIYRASANLTWENLSSEVRARWEANALTHNENLAKSLTP